MIIFVLAAAGLVFGSFVNALVWRLHEQAVIPAKAGIQKKQKATSPKDLSILRGRSMCPSCHHELAAKDLVPVLSWLYLRGCCRYCRRPISWQYPLVELAGAGLFVWSYTVWPLGLHSAGLFQLIFWLACSVVFLALAVYDLRWFILPDRLVLPLVAAVAADTVVLTVWLHSWDLLWQPALGAVVIAGLFWLLFQLSRGAWIGGGDVKLAVALGLLAGTPLRACLVIFLASLLGTLGSLPLMGRGRGGLRLKIPFGPYLLLATTVVVLYGHQLIQWYQNLLLT